MTNEQTSILLKNIYRRLNKAIHEADEKIVTKEKYPLSELHGLIKEIGDQADSLKGFNPLDPIYP
jgi:hypothetical protein